MICLCLYRTLYTTEPVSCEFVSFHFSGQLQSRARPFISTSSSGICIFRILVHTSQDLLVSYPNTWTYCLISSHRYEQVAAIIFGRTMHLYTDTNIGIIAPKLLLNHHRDGAVYIVDTSQSWCPTQLIWFPFNSVCLLLVVWSL